MNSPSVTSFVQNLNQSGLLDKAQADELTRTLQNRSDDPKVLAKDLVKRGWLTPYQASCVYQGKIENLVLGSFVLLEQLGEGGMGQVFKARHQRLGRIVALKIIRKERLSSPDAVRRFHREIQAAAQLRHPNVVLAYDADQGATRISSPWNMSRERTWRSWWKRTDHCPWTRLAIMFARRRWDCSTLSSMAWCTGTSSRRTFS